MNEINEGALFELIDEEHHATVKGWLSRGDGVAVYRNEAFDSSMHGGRKFVSFGSKKAQIEDDLPPKRLPDIGGQINWAYQLEGIVRPKKDPNHYEDGRSKYAGQ